MLRPPTGSTRTDTLVPNTTLFRSTRSRMMAGIRGKDTGPEVTLRRAMHARGFRYRLHVRSMPGRPDLVFPRYKAVVFVHGCFWHRHEGCRYATSPATRSEFWAEKFATNLARDRNNEERLRRSEEHTSELQSLMRTSYAVFCLKIKNT